MMSENKSLADIHPAIAEVWQGHRFDDWRPRKFSDVFKPGAIIGSVEIVEILPGYQVEPLAKQGRLPASPGYDGDPIEWFEGVEFNTWFLGNPHRYRQPIACSGRQSLWSLPADVLAAVAAAEAAADFISSPIVAARRPRSPREIASRRRDWSPS